MKDEYLLFFLIFGNMLWLGSRKYLVYEGIDSLVFVFFFGSGVYDFMYEDEFMYLDGRWLLNFDKF